MRFFIFFAAAAFSVRLLLISESLRRFYSLLFSFCTCRSQSQDKPFSIFNGTCFCWRRVFFIDLFCAVAAVATLNFRCGRDRRSRLGRRFSQAGLFLLKLLLFKLMLMSGVVKLTSGDDSWWKPDSTRLPLLVATAADGIQLVGGQKSRMVQAFCLSRFCLVVEIIVPFFHLGAATCEIDSCRTADFSSTRDRNHRKLLFFSICSRSHVCFIADRRIRWVGPDRWAVRDQSVGAPGGRARSQRLWRLYWDVCDNRDVTDQRMVNLQRI